jgi:hypothetical protein
MAQVYYTFVKQASVQYVVGESVNNPGIDTDFYGTTAQVEQVADWGNGKKKWNGSSVVACTEQEESDYAANMISQENLIDREGAKSRLDAGGNKALRALAELVLSEINLLRAEHAMPARTRAQLKTAMENALDSGDAD